MLKQQSNQVYSKKNPPAFYEEMWIWFEQFKATLYL